MTSKTKNFESNRFLKLSLRKNRIIEDHKKNRSSDVIILDESFDKYKSEFHKNISTQKIYSPIVINDSSELSDEDLPNLIISEKEPSKYGNISFNTSQTSPINLKESRPSIGGWSPAQNIICATPRNNSIPSTPRDEANESKEECSIKKIQQSQKKILNDLYGNTWKSIPKLFKTLTEKYDNFDGVTKQLQFDDDDEKENIRHDLEKNRKLYLTNSDIKRNESNFGDVSKKSKKKLYTEKVPSTPDVPKTKTKPRIVNTTSKKNKITKQMSITEMVEIMKTNLNNENDDKSNIDKDTTKKDKSLTNKDKSLTNKDKSLTNKDKSLTNKDKSLTKKDKILTNKVDNDNILTSKLDILTKKLDKVKVSQKSDKVCEPEKVKRFSFMGSLGENVPTWLCHPEAFQYIDNYKNLREQLTRRLFVEFNKNVFDNTLDADMSIVWDTKLRSTAGTTTNRLIKTASGDRIRTSCIKLSTKVLDAPLRLRDTLIHELCHAATWLLDAELKAGHGPLWKKWATRALRVYPELGEISRCHDMKIHFKYSYKCTKCGYSIQRHSKSIDVTKKCCGYCRGTFEVVLNKKNKDGVVVSTPARKGNTNEFAQYVKENYATYKAETKSHAQVMKLLGEQFSAKKNRPV